MTIKNIIYKIIKDTLKGPKAGDNIVAFIALGVLASVGILVIKRKI